MSLTENLNHIREELAQVARAAGRPEDAVRLIAVSKTKPIEMVREAALAGQLDFGENRVQELVEKQEAMPELRWHMIGNLQRNKVKYIAEFVHLIHSVDSLKLLKEINKRGRQCERRVPCLLQINISDEDQKGGFQESEAAEVLAGIVQFPFVEIRGLMGMAEFTDDEAVIRAQFRRLARAGEEFRQYEGEQVQMAELSMGMSGDFPIAVAEGATLVRVGSAIFGGRN